MMPVTKKEIIRSIVKYLREEVVAGELDSDQVESVDVARQCLESTYEIDEDMISNGIDLNELFNGADSTLEQLMVRAEEHKVKGNEFMKNDFMDEAIKEYSTAIKLNPNNAVFYCNRAAAFSRLENNRRAILDCKEAIKLNPNYGKAFGRLGIAYCKLGMYKEARDAFKRALELDPNNETYKRNLELTEDRLLNGSTEPLQEVTGPIGSGSGGGLAAAGVGAAGGGVGGAPPNLNMADLAAQAASRMEGFDITNFMSNPALLNMASQMLSEPSFRDMVTGIISSNSNNENTVDAFVRVGQELAQQIRHTHPDLINDLQANIGSGGGAPTPPTASATTTPPSAAATASAPPSGDNNTAANTSSEATTQQNSNQNQDDAAPN